MFNFKFSLNCGFIADNEEEFNKFYNDLESYGYYHQNIQSTNKKSYILEQFKLKLFESLEKIFDLERGMDEKWLGKKDEQSIQPTMWEVKWEQVISFKHFIAK